MYSRWSDIRKRQIAVLSLSVTYSWVILILAAGLTLSAVRNPSLIRLAALGVGLGLLLPIRFFYRNIEDIESAVEENLRNNREKIALATGLFIISSVSFVYGYRFPLSGILNLPFGASAILFMPVKTVYSDLLSPRIGSGIFQFGRFYLQFLWLYLISDLTETAVKELQDRLAQRTSLPRSLKKTFST